MKKFLFSVLALCTIAAQSATATEYTIVNNQSSNRPGTYATYGWAATLEDNYLTSTPVLDADVVTLSSISVATASASGTPTLTSAKLAIFERGASDGLIQSYVGLSELGSSTASAHTFKFSGVELTSDKVYLYLFVAGDTSDEYFSSALASELKTKYQSVSGSLLVSGSNTGVPTGSGTFNSNVIGTGGMGWHQGGFSANLTYNVQSVSETVPEPASATLSLLALAGLAARRRRK